MVSTGVVLLYLALGLSIYAIITGITGIKGHNHSLLTHSRRATTISVISIGGAALSLLRAFIGNDFRFAYVVRNSERSLPLVYKISALWAGQSGSLLLWLLILSIMTLIVHYHKRYREEELDTKVVIVINLVRVLFLVLLLFVTSPFEMVEVVPRDGNGLNPMLQSLGMVIHPPILFTGFSGFLIPFAFVVVDLLKRDKEAGWLRRSRPWVLFSWTMLTAGIVTGGQWAYTELGWGGYWAWDPVENASLFPWLTATALVHTLMMPKGKRHTKLWGVVLIMVTFLLTIFGTFLTRSGVLDSVHAFSSGVLGQIFLAVLGIIAAVSLYLGISRRGLLQDEGESADFTPSHWFSKWTSIQIANVVFLLIFVGVFLGTMFPLISRTFGDREIVLDESFYHQISIPLFLIVLFIMGISPICDWDSTHPRLLLRRVWMPGLAGMIIALFSYRISDGHVTASLSFAIGVFGLVAHLQEIVRKCHKRKLGAYLVHIGIILMLIGITGSSVFVEDVFQTVNPGDTVAVGDYVLEYPGLQVKWGIYHHTVSTTLDIYKGDSFLGELTSAKTFRDSQKQPSTDVGIFSTFKEDLYLNLAGWQSQTAQLHIQRFGLVRWIWLGSFVIYLGMLVIMIPAKKRS